jgi:hypothetical protein
LATSCDAEGALRGHVGDVAPSSCAAGRIGIRGVGKSTIRAMNPGFFREAPSYEFVALKHEMELLRAHIKSDM